MSLGFPGPLPARGALATAEPLADLAAVAVERALALSLGSERAEWFDRLAHTDPLTGLANRRTLDRVLELEVARAGRQGVPLSVAILEIDHFADIQKAGGNVAGDEALRRVAQILAESVRLMDTVARFGNEQFILVAPGPDGLVVAERLVRGIAALPPVDGKSISVSAGIAGFPLEGRTPDELLAVAREKAMRGGPARARPAATRVRTAAAADSGTEGSARLTERHGQRRSPSDGQAQAATEHRQRAHLGCVSEERRSNEGSPADGERQREMMPLTTMSGDGFVTLRFGSRQTKSHRLAEVGTLSTSR